MDDGLDLRWLGLERERPGHWSFELVPSLTRHDGKLYGGTGIAVTTAVMEAETGRRALWATVQFAGSADTGDRIDCDFEVLASGRRTSQVRLTASHEGRVVLAAIGATGEPRAGTLEVQFGEMPDVPPPDRCASWTRPEGLPSADLPTESSWLALADLRVVDAPQPKPLWMRMKGQPLTRAALGFLADMVPSGVVNAAGRTGAGTSLDNSMRFGPEPQGDWMLLDFDPWFANGGYLHGAGRVWSEDGTLLAMANQTSTALLFD